VEYTVKNHTVFILLSNFFEDYFHARVQIFGENFAGVLDILITLEESQRDREYHYGSKLFRPGSLTDISIDEGIDISNNVLFIYFKNIQQNVQINCPEVGAFEFCSVHEKFIRQSGRCCPFFGEWLVLLDHQLENHVVDTHEGIFVRCVDFFSR
jgi:hypothetical protein